MTHPLIQQLDKAALKTNMTAFRPGDTVRVHVKIIEGDKTRIQPFEGVVIRRRGSGIGATFSVRRVSFGEGVEKNFLLHAPTIEKVEVVRKGTNIHRGKLYYLRKSGRRSRELSS